MARRSSSIENQAGVGFGVRWPRFTALQAHALAGRTARQLGQDTRERAKQAPASNHLAGIRDEPRRSGKDSARLEQRSNSARNPAVPAAQAAQSKSPGLQAGEDVKRLCRRDGLCGESGRRGTFSVRLNHSTQWRRTTARMT